MSPATPQTRELAARDSDGIQVLLLWHPLENGLTVAVLSPEWRRHHIQLVIPSVERNFRPGPSGNGSAAVPPWPITPL